jgi:hypothetical protein
MIKPSVKYFPRGRALLTAALSTLLLGACGARAEQVGAVDTVFKFIGPDHKIVVDAYDDPKVAGVGGRDLLQDHPEWRPKEPLAERVGIFTWYGRSIGNHHRGTGPARKVHVLKGCNCIYRGALLRRIGFDERLRGAGAQVGWELSLAFDMRREGGELVYDPGIQVIHWVAPRHDSDSLHRGAFDPIGLRNMVYNEQLIFGTKAPPCLRLFYLIWTLAWGSRFAPGWVRALLLRSRGDKMAWERCGIAGSAMREVWKQALRLRSGGNSSR